MKGMGIPGRNPFHILTSRRYYCLVDIGPPSHGRLIRGGPPYIRFEERDQGRSLASDPRAGKIVRMVGMVESKFSIS